MNVRIVKACRDKTFVYYLLQTTKDMEWHEVGLNPRLFGHEAHTPPLDNNTFQKE